MSAGRTSRQFTISLPPEMAEQVELLAKREQRNISELFREAFRVYRTNRLRGFMAKAQGIAAAHAPEIETEEHVERLVKEVRAERKPGGKNAGTRTLRDRRS